MTYLLFHYVLTRSTERLVSGIACWPYNGGNWAQSRRTARGQIAAVADL